MIKAVTNVIVGDKTYTPGQIIPSLPQIDKAWMLKDGSIEETFDSKKKDKAIPKEEVKSEE